MNKMKKSYKVIGFPSGQDGASIPTRDYPPCPAIKISRKPYNKSFIDQACFIVKMAGYWSHFFFCKLMDPDSVSVHNHTTRELGQYTVCYLLTKSEVITGKSQTEALMY